MAGLWDFTVTNAKGDVPFVIEANFALRMKTLLAGMSHGYIVNCIGFSSVH